MSLLRVGVVEDNDVDFYVLQRGLSDVAELRRWPDGESLIRSLLDDLTTLEQLDVLLLDLGLPGIHGEHVAHTIRRARGGDTLPIVIFSGAPAPARVRQSLEQVVTSFEVKPSSRRALAAFAERLAAVVAERQPAA